MWYQVTATEDVNLCDSFLGNFLRNFEYSTEERPAKSGQMKLWQPLFGTTMAGPGLERLYLQG